MRVLIAHSDRLFGESLANALTMALDSRIVRTHFVDTKEELVFSMNENFDVLITATKLRDTSKFEDILRITQVQGIKKRILLEDDIADFLLVQAVQSNYNIFDCKNQSLEELADLVASENTKLVAPNSVLLKIFQYSNKLQDIKDIIPNLTQEKRKLIHYICEGLTTEEIAEREFKSPRTISGARYNLMKELRVKGIARLVVFAIENGLYEVNLHKRNW